MSNHLANRHAPLQGRGYRPGADEPHDFTDTLLSIVCYSTVVAALAGIAWPLITWAFNKV